ISNYTAGSTTGGLPTSVLAKQHTVKTVDSLDSFIIQISQNAVETGRFGNDTIVINGNNIKFDMFNVAGQCLTYDSNTAWYANTYKASGSFGNRMDITPLADNYVSEACIALSAINEKATVGIGNSFTIEVTSKLSNPYVSPVFN